MMNRSFLSLSLASVLLVGPFALGACSGGDIAVGSTSQDLKKTSDGGPTGDGGTCAWGDGSGPHKVGDTFPSPDGCNECSCTAQGIVCTERACAPADGGGGGSCTYDSKPYASGATFPSLDGCSQCTCQPDGTVACEATALQCTYTCPADKTIDCMPIVPPERAPLCSGPYHDWIAQNCGVTFAL